MQKKKRKRKKEYIKLKRPHTSSLTQFLVEGGKKKLWKNNHPSFYPSVISQLKYQLTNCNNEIFE